MRLERDKWYVLRNGAKAQVATVACPGQVALTTLVITERGTVLYMTPEGKTNPLNKPAAWDVVREYEEPKELWVNFYDEGRSWYAYHNKEKALEVAAQTHRHVQRAAVHMREVVK